MKSTPTSQRVRAVQLLYRALMDGKPDSNVEDFLVEKRLDAALELIDLRRDA